MNKNNASGGRTNNIKYPEVRVILEKIDEKKTKRVSTYIFFGGQNDTVIIKFFKQ